VTQVVEGTPRYFAWLYSGERMQAILKPLFGIEAQINAALQPGLEHSVAHARLTWWAEEAQRLRAGAAVHPLCRELLALQPAGSTAGPDLSGLVDVAIWDLASATFETGKELAGYCDRWAHAVTQLAAGWTVPELPPPLTQEFARSLGVALCELDMLIALQHSARVGRVRLPLDELAALDVPPDALSQTPWPRALTERLRERHRQLRGQLAASCAQPSLPGQRAALRGLLVWANLMQQHSRRAEGALPRTWRRSRWDGIGDALRAWRAARAAVRRSAISQQLKSAEHP
jgi:15-cis-phytoene synthase